MVYGLDERWGGGVWILGTENSICGSDRSLNIEQGTLDDGEGGDDGMTATGIPDRSTMSRNQWKRFKERAKRIQDRK